MKRRSILLFVAFFSVVSIGISEVTFAELISYPDFSDTTGLTLSYRAAELTGSDNILHLQDGRYQRGVALLTDPITLDQTFNTYFQFQIFNTVERFGTGSAADWLFFTIQTEDGIYGEAGNAVIVEFDVWNNGARDNYSGNHIGVNDGYSSVTTKVIQHVTPDFNNEQVWNAWIDYDGSNIEVFASNSSIRPDTPYISYGIDIPSILGTSDVYLGFHAASGQEGGDFDVLSWTFDTQPVPLPSAVILGSLGLVFAGWKLRKSELL